MKEHISRSLEDTRKIAVDFLASISISTPAAEQGGATVVYLSGHLGAGKTAFIKMIARELGITEDVTSPTFVIMKMYTVADARWNRLVHMDAYRLESEDELGVLKFDGIISDPRSIIFIEWPENIGITQNTPSIIPGHWMSFEIKGEDRIISW